MGGAVRFRRRMEVASAVLALGGLFAALMAVLRGALWAWRTTPDTWDTPEVWIDATLLVVGLALAVAGCVVYRTWLAQGRTTPATFLRPAEEQRLLAAIAEFEARTSGEIRVHLCADVKGDLLLEARRAFEQLGMTATRERNAVLFFVAVKSRRFAVLGDEGLDQRTPGDFWTGIVAEVEEFFRRERFADGLVAGVTRAGAALAEFFPPRPDDVNEMPDEISRS